MHNNLKKLASNLDRVLSLIGKQVLKSESLLQLMDQNIGFKEIKALATVLSEDENVLYLNLSNNIIDDEIAVYLAESLSRTNLRGVDLSSNKIGCEGVIALVNAFPDTKLSYVYLDNNNIDAKVEEAILQIARSNPLFVTRIIGLNISYKINRMVAINIDKLEIRRAEEGVCRLSFVHGVPAVVAATIGEYLTNSLDYKHFMKIMKSLNEAELGMLGLVNNHRFPAVVAAKVGEYVSCSLDNKEFVKYLNSVEIETVPSIEVYIKEECAAKNDCPDDISEYNCCSIL